MTKRQFTLLLKVIKLCTYTLIEVIQSAHGVKTYWNTNTFAGKMDDYIKEYKDLEEV